jgi:hypothetical protein
MYSRDQTGSQQRLKRTTTIKTTRELVARCTIDGDVNTTDFAHGTAQAREREGGVVIINTWSARAQVHFADFLTAKLGMKGAKQRVVDLGGDCSGGVVPLGCCLNVMRRRGAATKTVEKSYKTLFRRVRSSKLICCGCGRGLVI